MKIFDFTNGIKGSYLGDALRVNRVEGHEAASNLEIGRYGYDFMPGHERGRTFTMLTAADYGVPAICYCSGYHWEGRSKVWDWSYTCELDYARKLAGCDDIEAEYTIEATGTHGAWHGIGAELPPLISTVRAICDNTAMFRTAISTDTPEHAWHGMGAETLWSGPSGLPKSRPDDTERGDMRIAASYKETTRPAAPPATDYPRPKHVAPNRETTRTTPKARKVNKKPSGIGGSIWDV